MKTLPKTSTDNDILDLVRQWVDLLVHENYQEAYEFTAHNPYFQWSPQLLRAVIQGYGLPEPKRNGEVFRVTPAGSAVIDSKPRHEFQRLEHSRPVEGSDHLVIGNVWFDLPLNGKWSDLTATFEIRQNTDNLFLVLEEVHVF